MSHRLLGLDVAGRRVVVVGGGRVGARRALDLLGHGAVVHVVSPTLHPALVEHVAAERMTWVQRAYAGPADLEGAWLAHVATGETTVDEHVARDAEALRLWCIRAASAAASPVHVLATAPVDTDAGRVTVAVHAGGAPRLAVAVRERAIRLLARAAHGIPVQPHP